MDEHNSKKDAAPKRRPGRGADSADKSGAPEVKVVDVETGVHEAKDHSESSSHEEPSAHSESKSEPDSKKVEIKFFGSELLRAKVPQPFAVAEAIATDWVQGGKFDDLPIKHPLGQMVAQKGLNKAKELEKKVLESPMTEKVAMQVLTAGMKVQGLIDKLRKR